MNKETELIKNKLNNITDNVVDMICKANYENIKIREQIDILSYFIDKSMSNEYYITCSYYYKQYISKKDIKYIYSIIDITSAHNLSYHSNLQSDIDYALRKASMK